MLEQLFTVDKPPHFLFMKKGDDNHLVVMAGDGTPSELSLNELIASIEFMTHEPSVPAFRIFAMANEVARRSRRGVGNIVICNEKFSNKLKETEDVFELQHLQKRFSIVEFEDYGNDVIVLFHNVQSYNKSIVSETHTVIDGPLAIFQNKIYLNPNWKEYFVKVNLNRKLTKIEGPEPVVDEEKRKRLGWSRAHYDHINSIWHNIVKDRLDREFGSTAKLKSFGWFTDANYFTLDRFLEEFPPFSHEGKSYAPHAEIVNNKYRYTGYYLDPDGFVAKYCSKKDEDEGDSMIEVTFTLDDLSEEYKMVIDRSGTRRHNLER